MPIIRKKLWADELSDSNQRTSPTTGEYEVWDGTEWIPAPDQDPRVVDVFRLPPLEGDARCDAAARMRAHIQEAMENALEFTDRATIATSFLFGLGVVFTASVVGAWFGVLLLVADALLSIGISTVAAALTDEMYDELECIIYRNLSENGQMSADQAAAIQTEVNADIGGTAGIVIGLMFDTFGQVGLSNAAVVRTETGDCSACVDGWILNYDAQLGDGGWFWQVFGAGWTTVVGGARIDGIGWTDGLVANGTLNRAIALGIRHLPVNITTLTRLRMWFEVSTGTALFVQFVVESPDLFLLNLGSTPDGMIEWTGTSGFSARNMYARVGIAATFSGAPISGDGVITRIEFSGTGTPPMLPSGDGWSLIT